MILTGATPLQKTTSHRVVLPFYGYAALAFLLACLLLFFSSGAFQLHYFNPHTLAITHLMALGWGTMMILGASHQLVPVLVEGRLYSERLAWLSFVLAGLGIPLLVGAFYRFDMGWPALVGALLINLGLLAYLLNLGMSITHNSNRSPYAAFILVAICWLLLTTGLGAVLVLNFSWPLLEYNSLAYLPMHAHMGIIGWFLLLVVGVGARLIPMFLISKYTNTPLLWAIFGALNLGLISFILFTLCGHPLLLQIIPPLLVGAGILLFGYYCYQAYRQRIRRQVDAPMQVSLLSIALLALPLLLALLLVLFYAGDHNRLVLLYGFCIFFGWLTALILGMTFKTLPFIVWNRVYHLQCGRGKTPSPKDLFSERQFRAMAFCYGSGFIGFALGLLLQLPLLLKASAALLIAAAFLYTLNVARTIWHKPQRA
ncbi:hypothetical protein [Cesiribacter andamanensis]|uniref:Cbb3-type cytochrome oxidase, subunit 1 n=1 Tax=Cesiribacter andamanensis AMV16 TaxID=1279009 RepID=M7N510_9BACT|nr:hypothetical protein [Cesiribacter andamanensis]EMR02387.1 Cbb3-type cytochrome oxidase, subunit 1 [Cesiribacter andamanensis AMV16]